jgi:hypothetical protein
MVIFFAGNGTPPLRAAIAGSFHIVIWPRKDVRERLAVELQRTGLDAGHVDHRHDAADHRKETARVPNFASSSGLSGASDDPKSTVPALICAMPPPEPIDW